MSPDTQRTTDEPVTASLPGEDVATRRPGRVMLTGATAHTPVDCLGIAILLPDIVMVTAWGTARLIDTGIKSPVVRFNRTRVVIIDSEGRERSVHPNELSVMRRDGVLGFEGNR